MIKSKNFDSLMTIHNPYKTPKIDSNKNVTQETNSSKSEQIKDTIELTTSVEVNNEARIREIKEKIQNKEYKIDTNLIAKAMINDFSLLK